MNTERNENGRRPADQKEWLIALVERELRMLLPLALNALELLNDKERGKRMIPRLPYTQLSRRQEVILCLYVSYQLPGGLSNLPNLNFQKFIAIAADVC